MIYFRKIIDSINLKIFVWEKSEKVFWCLRLIREFPNNWKTEIINDEEIRNNIDCEISDRIEIEESLEKSYSLIEIVEKKYGFRLITSKQSWITKAHNWFQNLEAAQTNDENLMTKILVIFKHLTNDCNIEDLSIIHHYCKLFSIDWNIIKEWQRPAIKGTKIPGHSYLKGRFSFTFDSHYISHINQIELKDILHGSNKKVLMRSCTCLLNLKQCCAKIYLENDPETLQIYEMEARIRRKISNKSPILLEYFGNFQHNTNRYILMDLCKCDLSVLIEKGTYFNRNDLAYFSHLFIKGLNDLKTEQNLYHRDIKPQNIMITNTGNFKLIDFNIADEITDNSEESGIINHLLKGTAFYSAPEIGNALKGDQEAPYSRELADIYSLGIVIFEMHFCGTMYKSHSKSQVESKFELIRENIPWLFQLLSQMLSENFNDRPRFNRLLDMIEMNDEFMNAKSSYKKDWRHVRRTNKEKLF